MTELTFTHETFQLGDARYPEQSMWLLRGPGGVVQFKAGRHRIDLGACSLCADFRDISHFDEAGNCWYAWDLGYHSPVPKYDGHTPITTGTEVCQILAMESDCYYDGTSLGASDLLNDWLASSQSVDLLEARLRQQYQVWLAGDAEVFASPVTLLTEAVRRGGVA